MNVSDIKSQGQTACREEQKTCKEECVNVVHECDVKKEMCACTVYDMGCSLVH
jgi:hypothetical protein